MQFKVFPATLTPDGQKVPLIKGWREQASNDPEVIRLWQEVFRDRITFWGVPTGSVNGIIALDLDHKPNELKDGFSSVSRLSLPVPLTLTQRTRSGGAHFLYRYPAEHGTFGNRANMFGTKAEPTGIDVRGEGGWIAWYGIDANLNVPLAEAPEWILRDTAKPAAQVQGPAAGVAPDIALQVIQTSLAAIRDAAAGAANDTLNTEAFRVGQLVAGGAVSRDFAFEQLFKAAKDRGKPDYEARATINSGLDGGARHPLTSPFGATAPTPQIPIPPVPEPPARWTPNFLTEADLKNVMKLRNPQLHRDWSTEDITITTADGGTGKTTLALYEAICLALGYPFLGFQCVTPGKTLFITGEDTDKKLAARLGAIMRQMGLFEESPGNTDKVQTILSSILIKKDADLCLIHKDRNGFLTPNQDSLRKLREAIQDFRPKKVVFDPISSFWGSESALNDMNKAVTRVMSELVEYGLCAEMINHMGKSSSATKDMSQFAGRGGTGLPSNSRVSRVLRSIDAEEYEKLTNEPLENGKSAMLCNVNKFSDGSPLLHKPFVIIRDGYLFSRKNLSPAKEKEMERVASDTERVFAYVKEERRANRYPTREVVEGYFTACGDPIPKVRVKTALNLLQYTGWMGAKLMLIENPNATIREKALVITDQDGRELNDL